MRILLQFPEGLRMKALKLAEKLEKKGNEVFIFLEPCYGACDIPVEEAKMLHCDKIIHYGHTKFFDTTIPVEYVEIREDIRLDENITAELEKIREKNIGLLASLQFLNLMKEIEKFLKERGKIVFIGSGKKDGKALYSGQILGCDYSQAMEIEKHVDCFLLISSGNFHAKGLVLKTKKNVYLLDVEKKEIKKVSADDFLKQKLIAQELAKDANKFGIIISTKIGQFRAEIAKKIKDILEKHGKKAFILIVDEIKPEKFEYLGIECLINTGCPRVAIEERSLYKIPILNWDEFLEIYRAKTENGV